MRIFLIGYMGSGKTTVGRKVANKLNMGFVDMDAMIESKLRKTVADIFAELGEEKFRALERECLLEVADYDDVVISTGGGSPCFFDNMEVMNRAGETIYLSLTPTELSKRLRHTAIRKRPILADRQGDDLETFIAANLEKREPFYNRAAWKVNGADKDVDQQIIRLVEARKI